MRIVFKKDPTKKYCCDNCGKQFNWEQGKSRRWGKHEYKTLQEEREIERTFCSKQCLNEYFKLK